MNHIFTLVLVALIVLALFPGPIFYRYLMFTNYNYLSPLSSDGFEGLRQKIFVKEKNEFEKAHFAAICTQIC